MESFDVVILGAGAAGLMCAISAGRRGRRVLLLDHADEPGKKILISGGGRCNFTNREVRPDNFLSDNPHFARSALARYRPEDFVALLQRHAIGWHEKTLGQLFCDGSARQVVAMLLAECAAAGIVLRCGCRVTDISRGDRYRIETGTGSVTSSSLVLATGGLSIPKLGATGFSHDVAARFGLALTPIRPALVPLTFGGDDGAIMHALSGVSLPVVAACGGARFGEALLFTHRGLSGPAILQVSSYWRQGESIALELLPDAPRLLLQRKRARPRAEARTVLAELLPARLAQALAERHLPALEIGNIPDRLLRQLAGLLTAWRLTPSGTEGYAKAEVTGGGIDTRSLSSRTMQSEKVPGLFAIGEAVDVTGWLGGYNFQWAWASGWVAGEAA
ncbi:NAD(P)/FAD-dependent oxidoreductase [Lichenicoccus sp.]|uniref:NAD(P)/FAD-dependent oxidoreductase n=1 Tax=Lichenicoccus sp. TaxID=2781899 RepID=UPI003D0D588C